ncbi:hypothetical protein [Caldivirga sp. MU80]|uniref:hypothetical protein n=1 Tax=Caldivirga sp. MU80 TaxID=1650354 RepID=UPI00083656BC|nr:hypothetical protein [Caldivirga sp. MU80]
MKAILTLTITAILAVGAIVDGIVKWPSSIIILLTLYTGFITMARLINNKTTNPHAGCNTTGNNTHNNSNNGTNGINNG